MWPVVHPRCVSVHLCVVCVFVSVCPGVGVRLDSAMGTWGPRGVEWRFGPGHPPREGFPKTSLATKLWPLIHPQSGGVPTSPGPPSGWPGPGLLPPTLGGALSAACISPDRRWEGGQACSVSGVWPGRPVDTAFLALRPLPPSAWTGPLGSGRSLQGMLGNPLGGSEWGLGWALGVADLPGAAARGIDLTGSQPPRPG